MLSSLIHSNIKCFQRFEDCQILPLTSNHAAPDPANRISYLPSTLNLSDYCDERCIHNTIWSASTSAEQYQHTINISYVTLNRWLLLAYLARNFLFISRLASHKGSGTERASFFMGILRNVFLALSSELIDLQITPHFSDPPTSDPRDFRLSNWTS